MSCSGSSTIVSISPQKKRRRVDLGHFSIVEKQCVLNMYKTLVTDSPKMKMTVIVNKICNTEGISESSVYRIIKEYKKTGNVTASQRSGGRPSIISAYSKSTKSFVRRIVHSFFLKNEIPTINQILNEMHQHPNLPSLSRSSLYKLLKQINFKYLKRNRKSILTEREDIIRCRRKYLRSMKQFRSIGRNIYYLGETWFNEGHTKEKGERLIVLHVGSECGFVEKGLLLFESKKTVDYYEEMNSAVFEEWYYTLLHKLPENAVIVMDNTSYNCRKLEKIPTSSSMKHEMQEWLRLKNINFDEDMVRAELLQLIQLHKDTFNLYVTDDMATKEKKNVLRLPPYHCELNPIEMIWAKLKNEVATKNTTFKLQDVKQIFLTAVQNITSANWQNCIAHVIEEEEKMSKLDGIMDNLIEPFIISLGDDSSEISSSESSDEDS